MPLSLAEGARDDAAAQALRLIVEHGILPRGDGALRLVEQKGERALPRTQYAYIPLRLPLAQLGAAGKFIPLRRERNKVHLLHRAAVRVERPLVPV